MAHPKEKFVIEDWIRGTLKAHGFKKTGKMVDYERAKRIIEQYYPDYYDLGIKIAADMVGV